MTHRFFQKIEDYMGDPNTNYVIWANSKGMANVIEISQKHARKCTETMHPALNGYKVGVLVYELYR